MEVRARWRSAGGVDAGDVAPVVERAAAVPAGEGFLFWEPGWRFVERCAEEHAHECQGG